MRSSSSSNKKMRISTPPKKPTKVYNDVKGESMEWSFIGMDQLMLMMKVHKKIFVFRDIMDLAPLNTSASLREVLFTFLHVEVTQNVLASFITLSFIYVILQMVITSLEDLQRLYPRIISIKKVTNIKDKSIDQVSIFCYT